MRYFTLLIISVLSIVILRINIKLHSENYTKNEKKKDIILQLNFIESQLKNNNLGERMQQIFPEGYVFVNVLYGLAWCELALSDTHDTSLHNKALRESLYAFDNLDSEIAKWPFPSDLNPENGIFYNGWKNYLLSKILSVDTTFKNQDHYISKFKTQSENIVNALKASNCPFLESYNSQVWPADMFVAMASISKHDEILSPKYQSLIKNWISEVKYRLDPVTGIIPHKVDYKTGKTIQGARGCSIGLILRMLGEIDPIFAKDQFVLMKDHFISKTFGLPSIREYPKGQHGLGDIDSGPVIFGVGFSATIVMIGTLAMYESQDLADQQYKTIHAFGFDIKTGDQKMYLFGKLPVADAFIAWGRATTLNYYKMDYVPEANLWQLKFHLITIMVLMFLWILYFRKQLYSYLKTATKNL